jgi:alkaline phosphatase D
MPVVTSLTRRSLIAGFAAGAGALALGRDPALPAARGAQAGLPLIRGASFGQGVASGQQATNGITLWTRLDGIERTSRLQVEIARDEGFGNVIYRQDVVAGAENGFAVHHRAENAVLRPGEQFFYRFYTCDENSPVGRFRTARPADSRETVRIGFFSCQAYDAGFYTAHSGLANEDLDVVVCLGDYIYEQPFYNTHRADTTGANKDGEVQTLEEYREKYALYHSDQRLREVRRRHPIISIWDDHEVEDNWAAEREGHAAKQRRVEFLQRRANGFRAFFEHMPRIRVPSDADRIYGSIPLGANAELLLLDQRSFRDDQPCDDQFFVPCTESEAPGRTLLGGTQKAWLKERLTSSPAAWKIVGTQAMIMSLDGPSRNEVNKDQWDGYAAERAELIDFLGERDVRDVSFITGDIHTFFAGGVTRTGRSGLPGDGPARATEFVGGAITSEGILPPSVEDPGGLTLEGAVTVNNPHIQYSNFREKGYAVAECTAEELRVRFRAARTIAEDTSDVFDLARFRVARGTTEIEQQA